MGKQLPDNNSNHELAKRIDEISRRLNALEDKEKQNEKILARHGRGLQDIEEEYPLLPPEADDLSKLVKRKGVEVLGGKKSPAYRNVSLRRRVYRDIYGEIKRNYGLIDELGRQQSYKKLKRKNLNGAFIVVQNYVPPISIENDIDGENELEDCEE